MPEEPGMPTDDDHVTLCFRTTISTEVSHYFILPQLVNPSSNFFKKDCQDSIRGAILVLATLGLIIS